MKLNISYPVTGAQKVLDIDDDNKLRAFYDKRISHEVTGDHLGDEYKGYVFKISGGNDKQGFCMTQGILTTGRVRILMREGMPGYRVRKRGERKRKSARGCIVSSDLSVLNLVIVKKGDADIEGLTTAEAQKPRRLGPKRASKIRRLFNLSKEDDVRQFVVRRPITTKSGKTAYKAPKIQRLVTPQRLQHKRQRLALKRERYERTKADALAYNELLAKRHREQSAARASKLAARRSSRRASEANPKAKSNAPAPSQPVLSNAATSAAATTPAPKPAKTAQAVKPVVKAAAADSTATAAAAPKAAKAGKAAAPKAAKPAEPKAAKPAKAAQPKAAKPQ